MRKGIALMVLAILFPASAAIAQVFNQNQIILPPFGSNGFVVSTTTGNSSKLSASSTPYFANFFATNGTSTNFAISNLLTFGGVIGNSWDDFCTAITGGSGLCDGIDASGSGSGNVSTSTGETAGQLAYWTSTNATPALLGKVATSTPGVTSPITYSGTLGSFVGGVAGNFGCATCALTSTTLTVAGTANQITSSTGAQDLSANRTWTLSLPSHVIFPGDFFVNNSTTTNATTTALDITSRLTFGGVTGTAWSAFCTSITGGAGLCDGTDATGAGGSAAVATSTNETAGQLAYWTSTAGTPALLGQVATGTLAASSPVTVTAGRSIIGGSGTIAWDFSVANSWTGLQTFAAASTTRLSCLANCAFGSTATSTFDSAGALTLATPLLTTSGGTGLSSWTQGDIPYYTSGTALSKLAKDTNSTRYLSNQGASNAPSWNQINLTNGVTGTLPYGNGGTGSTTAPVGQLLYGGATAYQSVATSSATCTGASGVTCTTFTVVGAGGSTIALSAIPNSSLANSTISGVALGNNLNALTNGSTLLGSSYNGSSAISDWDIDLSNPNTWTGKQNFYGTASSTLFSAHYLKVGATASTTIDTAGNVSLPAAGTLTIPALTSALLLTDGNGLLAEYAGSSCTNQTVTAISALGAATCTTINGNYLDLTANYTWTGAHDFGGATSLEIPNGTAPTVDAIGEIALDTTSGNVVFATSTNATSVVAASATSTLAWFTMASTSPDAISGGIMDVEANFLPIVVTGVICHTDAGTSQVINISNSAGSSDSNTITCTTSSAQYAFTSNNSFAAYASWRVEMGTKTGSWDYLHLRFIGYRKTD